ncbi:MAG: 1-(5-phosphoribosyl)-5-[(5-phosphoribosylamino)methylideneamino]imidazole-4-carboxamide isomerase [Acidobacteriota bacterium]
MIEIIPAIDLMSGKCVRLTQGDFSRRTVYSDNPVDTAKRFADAGIRRLHMVDLDGAKSGSPANIGILEDVADAVDLAIDFGGGIKTATDVKRVFDAGAEMVNLGSIAVTEPDDFFEWLDHFGGESILLGADVRAGKLAINGWQETTEIEPIPFLAEYHSRGGEQAFVTDIGSDGAMQGPAVRLYKEINMAVPGLKLIASGGVTSVGDIDDLGQMGCSGVIIGKAIYEGTIKLEQLARYVG